MKNRPDLRERIRLSEGEQFIARMLVRGYSQKEIAAMRHTETCTVSAQLTRIYAKLNIHKNTELVVWALRHNLR